MNSAINRYLKSLRPDPHQKHFGGTDRQHHPKLAAKSHPPRAFYKRASLARLGFFNKLFLNCLFKSFRVQREKFVLVLASGLQTLEGARRTEGFSRERERPGSTYGRIRSLFLIQSDSESTRPLRQGDLTEDASHFNLLTHF